MDLYLNGRGHILFPNSKGPKVNFFRIQLAVTNCLIIKLCSWWCFAKILYSPLKGLSHEIFDPVFWAVWIYLGLNMNRLWFLNFNDVPLILDTYFRFWHISGQTFSKILRISENDWQLSLQFSDFRRFLVIGSPRNAAKGGNIS